jgi:hypothetical protein
MTRFSLITACAVLAGCSGGGARTNAAAGTSFTYGAPSAANATQAAALDPQLSSAVALKGTLDASGATTVSDLTAVSSALLGSSGTLRLVAPVSSQVASSLAGRSLSVAPGSYDVPTCVTATAQSVTFANCTTTTSSTDAGGVTTTTTGTVSGSLNAPAPGSLNWDLVVQVSASNPQTSLSVSVHLHGALTVTDTTVKGEMLSETALSATASGQSISAAEDESLDIDVTYTPGPPGCVTDGTLEVKRVWVERPSGATAASLPNQGAKVTWTGCGIAQIAFSN